MSDIRPPPNWIRETHEVHVCVDCPMLEGLTCIALDRRLTFYYDPPPDDCPARPSGLEIHKSITVKDDD